MLMAKYCPNCGTENAEEVLSCSKCGVQFNVSAPTEVASQAVTEAPTKQKTDVCALIGFILSLVSNILCCGYLNIPAIILCILGIIFSKKNGTKGFGFALAGIIITVVIGIIWIVLNFTLGFFDAASSYYY